MLFTLGIGFFVMHYMFNTTIDKMLTISQINQTNQTVQSLQGSQKVLDRLDYIIFVVFIGMALSLIIMSWFVGGNPILSFIYFIVIVIGVAFSTVLSNVWESISQSSIFGNTIASFTITNNIMLRLPLYMSIVGLIGLIVMFAKPYVEEQ